MSKYGEAAVKTVKYIKDNNFVNPREAWEVITREIFGVGTASQAKGCPKTTFLGLCETGIVHGIPKGEYTKSDKNKKYGLKAIELIKNNPELINNKKELWKRTIEPEEKVHNSQMDVVIELWNNRMIR
ncbi:hypothetical protein [Paenibacillus sp. FSL W8-0194]|uniref:DUF6979 family protein n=1 Tax=Paenibacillus sp. FSL W8-0194 TaxID=2921711 RepID=UPI0030DA9114